MDNKTGADYIRKKAFYFVEWSLNDTFYFIKYVAKKNHDKQSTGEWLFNELWEGNSASLLLRVTI